MSNYGSIQRPSGSQATGATTGTTGSSFSPTEFIHLKESIYNNIILIKKQFHKLEKIVKLISTKADNEELRTKM